MDEYIDILNENGGLTGKSILKSEAHKNGIYHASAHIWIFDKEKNVLIQKRTATKDTFPNLWDISVAGHISTGEKPIISALREIKEEVGITVLESQLHFIGTSKKRIKHHDNLIDNELHYIYLCEIDFDIDSLKIQEEEVSEIRKLPLNELFELIKSDKINFVPRSNAYYKLIFSSINNFNP